MEKRKNQIKKLEVLGMKNKKGITLIALIITMIIAMNFGLFCKPVYADFQIRPNFGALRNTTAPDFFYKIRLMETEKGPMGLDMPNTDTNVYGGYGANNIDVHMIRNCEWGVVAMLQMSGYGAGEALAQYSSGNATGVKQLGNDNNWEFTASLATTDGTTIYTKDNSGTNNQPNAKALADKNVDLKYIDLYYIGGKNGDEILTSNTAQDREKFYTYNYRNANPSSILNHVR